MLRGTGICAGDIFLHCKTCRCFMLDIDFCRSTNRVTDRQKNIENLEFRAKSPVKALKIHFSSAITFLPIIKTNQKFQQFFESHQNLGVLS